MLAKYPEIIDELIKRAKSGELRSFDLSSFMSDKSLEYDSQNRFIFHREEESLWLNFFDLVGNFQIDWQKSKGILKDVNRIEGSGVISWRTSGNLLQKHGRQRNKP
ncbi:MAG: hypothetical protein U9N19_08195 [Thermodesulfobacteriota bacterium]|nr:hypothetical protein [Thermodesulfobacteriota bacterium]